MFTRAPAVLAACIVSAACIVLVACSVGGTATHPSPSKAVPMSALDGLLLSVADVNAVMGTDGMTVHQPFSAMEDHRNLLPNLNCLGIWQIGEKAIYGASAFTGVRGQVLREPDTDDWTSLVVQAAVSYLSSDSAKRFFDASSDRWSKCTNHKVNLTVNDRPLGSWTFGALANTGTELTMPMNRTGDNARACQRALAVDDNVIIDVTACAQTIGDQANSIADKIEAKIAATR